MAAILLVSLGATAGLRAADDELAASIERAGAAVDLVRVPAPREVRTLALTDLGWARAARAATLAALHEQQPDAVIYSSVTAALLAPRAGAIRFDALAASNRPGRHGIWQRRCERRRLAAATLLLPWSEASLAGVSSSAPASLVVPVPIERSAQPVGTRQRDIAAITYAANPHKKGLDRILAAWRQARRPDEELLVAGLRDMPRVDGVRAVGQLPDAEYRALVRRARVFLSAPRREDYGLAQLEALADGCVLVTTPAPGAYVALTLARTLDARLVGDDLGRQIRIALDDPLPEYAAGAQELLGPYSRASVDRVVASELLPRLGVPAVR
jgi:hypothetical protein